MVKHDLSLEHLFAFIDKDRSQSISIEELTKGLQNILTPDECLALFMSIDKDGNKNLSYEELVIGCNKIHASYILFKLKQAIQGGGKSSNLSIDEVFRTVLPNADENPYMDIF